MTFRLRLLYKSTLLVLLTVLSGASYAQVFTGEHIAYSSPNLTSTFSEYEVYQVESQPMAEFIRSHAETPFILHLGNHVWNLNLNSSNLISPDYFIKTESANGDIVRHNHPNIAFKGYENGKGRVRLTVDKNMIYGYIEQEGKLWRIEPLWYIDQTADKSLVVVYEKSKILPHPAVSCGVTEDMEKSVKFENSTSTNGTPESTGVYELELAIASDQTMLAKYGSDAAVEAHNVAVINDVEGDYTGNFNNDLCINIVAQYVASTFPGPWTSSTDAGTLLASFASWGNNGGFGVNFDIGELWTNRDFDGSTIGIAYLNAVCNGNKYHCLQDFSNDSELLRCMTAHEMGHNFSAVHDVCSGGDFIMCPFVSNSNVWSSASQNAINGYMQQKINSGCLSSCVQGPPLVAGFEWDPEPGCVNQPVQFTDLSTGNIASRLWTFTGGTPASSTQQNPVASFNTPGPHTVTLLITGSAGNSASANQTINIDPLPVANFTYTVDDLTLTFTNTSQNASDYFWEFGDGGTSTDVDPVYTYFEAGTYVVKLYANNHCGSVIKTFTVNTFPTPDFSADPSSGCATLSVQLTNESSSNSTTFQWQFPGGSPAASNQPNPLVLYTVPGTYSITLTAFNSAGSNSVTKTNYITVLGQPAPGFTSSSNGLTVTFTNTSVNSTSYLWNFGDGATSTQTNPTHTYANGGTYTVSLTAINDCGSIAVTHQVNLGPPPVASFSTSAQSGCAPFTASFINTSTGALSYNWQFPGGTPSSSTDTNATTVYNTAGTYVVTLTATNASGTSTATDTIVVTTVPGASFTSSTNGDVATFTNGSTHADSYAWNFGDGGTSTDANPTHTYSADGVYTVTLTATNSCGSVTFTQTVTIVTPPLAGFNAGPVSGCAPLTVQFNNTSSSNSTSFQWTFPGGNPSSSTAQNPTVVYSAPGTYSVTLVASNSAGSSTVTQTDYIVVNTVPAAAFSNSVNGAVVTFTNGSTNADTYSWNFGDGNTSTQTNPTHTYANDGVYTVVLSATNACGTVTTTQTVTIATPPLAGFTASPTSGCVPLTVQFTSTSSNNAVTFAWQFPGGDPSTSSNPNPVVVYNTPGVYSVTLTVSNGAGSNTASQVNYITVGTTPSASFTSTVNDSTATFTNNTLNGNTYSWDFGDGTSSTATNPSHQYMSDGAYTVVLTAANNCGTSTYTQSVVVITSPNSGFTANTTSGCGPLQVSFMNLSSENSDSWAWSFPGGTPDTSSLENPVVIYSTPGVYDVTLVASGPGGSSTFTAHNFITVLAAPTAGFTFTSNSNTVSFSNTSTGATSYLWNFGDGNNSTQQNPNHTYTADGVYTVVLLATNNCGTTIVEQTVTIVTVPVAAFTFNAISGCAPLTVLFNNTSSNNASDFEWSFEGGNPTHSTDMNPSSTWTTPGVYTVILTASNSAGSSTASATITVSTVPAAGFNTQEAGLSVIFSNTTTNGTSYSWDFGDGAMSSASNPTHDYTAAGAYTVVLTATNDCGTSTATKEVVIAGSAPITSFTSNLTSGCAGMTVQFTDSSLGNPTSWNWTFPGGTPATSTDQNPSVTYNTPGIYDVTLETGNPYGSDMQTSTGYIIVQSQPTSSFTNTMNAGTVTFSNTSQNATGFVWNFGDGTATSNEINPTHTYEQSGTYTVTLTATNSCGSAAIEQTITVVLSGTHEVSWVDHFSLYPNPNTGHFTVEMSGTPQKQVEFALYNNLGQLISSRIVDFSSGHLSQNLDYTYLPSAVYNLRITGAGETMNVQVIVQK